MMIDKPDLNLLADDTLYKLVKNNNREALLAIYDRYSPNLYVYIIQIVGTRIRGIQLQEDTKEILILVFDYMWTNRHTLPRNIKLEDYLFASAYRHALNYTGLHNPGDA